MLFAYLGRGMVQNPRNKGYFRGRVGGYEGRRRPAEVMQTHGFAELGEDAGAHNRINLARGERASFVRCPEPVMKASTEKARPDLLEVAKQVGQELFRDAEAFCPLGFGVLRKQ